MFRAVALFAALALLLAPMSAANAATSSAATSSASISSAATSYAPAAYEPIPYTPSDSAAQADASATGDSAQDGSPILKAQADGTHAAIQAPAADMPPSSIYCWSPYALAPEASTGDLFKSLNIKRVYQSFGSDFAKILKSQDTADAIAALKDRGIEVYLLCGQPNWGMSEAELAKPKARIDAIRQYNGGIGAAAPIKGVVFDIESFTSEAWKADEAAGFRTYVNNMKTLYNYAKANNVQVIQCIPRWLENRNPALLEEIIKDCCDEISVMNYAVGSEVNAIATEEALCQQYGKPIESIFNTMPPNGGTIPEDSTYYNRTFDDLLANWGKLMQRYGEGAVSMSYHHILNVVPVLSGGGLIADIYVEEPAADATRSLSAQADGTRSEPDPASKLSSITLKGSDGSVITAGRYHPDLMDSQTAFLAIGVKPGVSYTVESGDPAHYRVLTKTPAFAAGEKDLTLRAAIQVEPGSEIPDAPGGNGGGNPESPGGNLDDLELPGGNGGSANPDDTGNGSGGAGGGQAGTGSGSGNGKPGATGASGSGGSNGPANSGSSGSSGSSGASGSQGQPGQISINSANQGSPQPSVRGNSGIPHDNAGGSTTAPGDSGQKAPNETGMGSGSGQPGSGSTPTTGASASNGAGSSILLDQNGIPLAGQGSTAVGLILFSMTVASVATAIGVLGGVCYHRIRKRPTDTE